jgi:hypothetical protein
VSIDGVTSVGALANRNLLITPGLFSTAIGAGVDSVTGPTSAQSTGDYSIAIGGGDGDAGNVGAVASGRASIAIGDSSKASEFRASAVGAFSEASEFETSAYGFHSTASEFRASAFGTESTASGQNSAAYGAFSTASGVGSSAYGNDSTAQGDSSTAIGDSTFAAGLNDTAVGAGARVEADSSSAFGTGAHVLSGHTNSTALGTGATTTRANQIMMGTGTTTYTMAGIASNASKAAQGSPTHLVTSNAAGDLAAYTPHELGLATTADLAGFATKGDVSALQGQIDKLDQRDRKLTEGLAVVASLAQPMMLAGQKFAMRGGWGGYGDANAVSFTAAGVLAQNVLRQGYGTLVVDGGVGFGTDEGETVSRAGLSFGW